MYPFQSHHPRLIEIYFRRQIIKRESYILQSSILSCFIVPFLANTVECEFFLFPFKYLTTNKFLNKLKREIGKYNIAHIIFSYAFHFILNHHPAHHMATCKEN